MPFGRHRGRLVRDLPDHYLIWLINNVALYGDLRCAVEAEYEARDLQHTGSSVIVLRPEQRPIAREIVDAGYHTLARRMHPDAGGTNEQMILLTAVATAMREQLTALESR